MKPWRHMDNQIGCTEPHSSGCDRANLQTGAIVSRQNFNQRLLLDRMVGVGVAAHEGQLFGLANQLLSLATAMGLVTLCVSAIVLWWLCCMSVCSALLFQRDNHAGASHSLQPCLPCPSTFRRWRSHSAQSSYWNGFFYLAFRRSVVGWDLPRLNALDPRTEDIE